MLAVGQFVVALRSARVGSTTMIAQRPRTLSRSPRIPQMC